MQRRAFALVGLLTVTATIAVAGEANGPGARMDYGDVVSYYFINPTDKEHKEKDREIAYKGISVRLGKDAGGGFDAETMRFVAGWTGGFVDMTNTTPARNGQGAGAAPITGKPLFGTRSGPGWASKGDFKDPRPGGIGNLPTEWAQYRGLYRNGDQVVFSYTVGGTSVRELPGAITGDVGTVITRTIEVGKGGAQAVLICEVPGAGGGVGPRGATPGSARSGVAETTQAVLDHAVDAADAFTAAAVAHAPKGATLEVADGRIVLKLPAQTAPVRFVIAMWSGGKASLGAFAKTVKELPVPADLEGLCQGGKARWESITTSGKPGGDGAAYVVDTVTLPTTPWNSWMRPTGLDFFADGSAAVCTFGGEVWLVSGLDATLTNVVWKRFATGLFEPLGLRIVDGVVYVLGRDQITRLHDLNKDGEADFYENFNNVGTIYRDYHDFTFDLQTDRAGNFYYVKGGNRVPSDLPLHSCVLKISKDGTKHEVFATGFRAANGMGMGPNDELTVGDNQGHWTPANKIDLVKKGGWYGYVSEPRIPENKNTKHPATFDPPLCWIPMSVDNSSGGQVWVTGDQWGPLKGQMLHLSYGQSRLMAVMYEEVGGVPQGGVAPFALKFDSGIMRARFSPKDGQLYVCGIKGWQTNAGQDGCLQRVRYTGKPVYMPTTLHVNAKGVQIGFSTQLDKASVNADGFAVEQWNYLWTETYGSPDVSVADPSKKTRDKVTVTNATLSADGKTITLDIPGLRPVMQMAITCKIQAADGTPITQNVYNTINVVPR